jgi:hypothetical protein
MSAIEISSSRPVTLAALPRTIGHGRLKITPRSIGALTQTSTGETSMQTRLTKTSLAFAAVLSAVSALPIAAFADTSNATHETTVTGAYDGADKFKDATGRPLPGWQYLIYSANGNG